MGKKSTFILLGITAAIISYCIYKKKQKSFKSIADKYYNNKDYSNAIYYYLLYLNHAQDRNSLLDIYNKLSYCYIKLKQYNQSLNYLNLSLNLNLNPTTLKWRFECYKKLDMKNELCKDLFLYSRIINDQEEINKIKDQADILIKEISTEKCSSYLLENELFVDFEEYEYIFEPFISLVEEYKDNEIIHILVKKDYKELHNFLFNKNNIENINKDDINELKNKCDEIKNLFKSMILFYKGFIEESISLIQNSSFKYSKIIRRFFLNSQKNEKTLFCGGDNVEGDNCTIDYFMYKITKDIKYIIKYKYNFIYPQLILHYLNLEEYNKIEEIINTVDYSSYIPLIILIGEYKIKRYQTLIKTTIENPRIDLIKALFYIEINKKDVSIDILKNSIQTYPTFFKSYLYLGNLLMEDLDECENMFKKGLQYCNTYNELLVCNQALMFVEIERHIKLYDK